MKATPLTWALRIAIVLLLIATSIAWVAAGKLGEATTAGLEQTSVALDDAIELADSTAKIAQQVQYMVISVGLGMQTASEAIGHVSTVSENVRSLLNIVSVFNKVDDLRDSLANTEASLAEAAAGLEETKDNLVKAEPAIADAVTVLQSVPEQLQEADTKIAAAADRVDDYVTLSRIFIVLLAISMLVLFFAVERMSRRPVVDVALAGDAAGADATEELQGPPDYQP